MKKSKFLLLTTLSPIISLPFLSARLHHREKKQITKWKKILR
nr:variable surface lipoprotein [Mycoplasmopsis bovis]